MGCDIHTIVEIRKNGKWEYIPDLPIVFDSRSYGVFSILNRNVRNSYGRDGFEQKGLPKDVSGRRFRFTSHREELEKAYKHKETFVCYIGGEDKKYVQVYDECLKTEIDFELYEELKSGMTHEQSLRYYSPTQTAYPQKYFVQDAQKVGGQFMEVPYRCLYSDIKKFNKAYYNYPWYDEEQDFGYYDVDFDSDLHSHSFLSLAELKTKVITKSSDKKFLIDNEFLVYLKEELGGDLPETMIIGDEVDGKSKVSFVVDPYETCCQENYNEGVEELCKIKEKYNIENDEDIRIVFAFDS